MCRPAWALAPAQGLARGGAGRLAIFEDEGAVDEDVVDPLGRGPAGGVGRAVGDGERVEDRDVGRETGAEEAAVGQAVPPRGVGGEVGDGFGPVVVAEG